MEPLIFVGFAVLFSLLTHQVRKALPQRLKFMLLLISAFYFTVSLFIFFLLVITQGNIQNGLLWLYLAFGLFYASLFSFIVWLYDLIKHNRRSR